MKKKFIIIVTVALTTLLSVSCRKNTEKIIDCFGESLLVGLSHTADTNEPRKINFTVKYSGKLEIGSVKLEYGDGQSEIISGTSATHTFSNPGTFNVKALVRLKNENGYCEVDPVRNVTIK